MKNILFYKFVELTELKELRKRLQAHSVKLDLRGKVLIAEEGVNGCVSGTEENIETFKEILTEEFGEIAFKEGTTNKHTFRKMFVRIRDEIITFKQDIDLENIAPYIEPRELKEALDKGEEIVLLDARNAYESRIGKFSGAIAPNIEVFTELPEELKKLSELKDKRIVTYCTGGIRCEKSATWMKANGFTNVQQLHGGIIRYGKECGNTHWEGKCFVFDKRGAVDIDPKNQNDPISQCELCSLPTSDYHNCALIECDKYFLCCQTCIETLEGCCSKRCRGTIRTNPQLRAVTDDDRPVQMK